MDALAASLSKQLDMVISKGSALIQVTSTQLIQRQITTNMVNALAFLFFLILALVGMWYTFKWYKKEAEDCCGCEEASLIIFSILTVAALMLLVGVGSYFLAAFNWSHYPAIQVTEYVLQNLPK